MRIFIRGTISTVAGNKAITQGQITSVLEKVQASLAPESLFLRAVETGPSAGLRTINLVVSADSLAKVESVAETLFKQLEAKVELEPVLSLDEFVHALPAMEDAIRKYGDDGR